MSNVKEISRLKIVTLEPLYDNWNNSLARELFDQSVDVKLRGFAREYPYGVMPVDTTDFIAHHHLICRETRNGLQTLCAFKSVSLSKAQAHNVMFPALSLVKLAGGPSHVQAVEKIMENAQRMDDGLIYNASFTMCPEARRSPFLLNAMRDIFKAIYILFPLEYGYKQVIAGGTMRFKVDKNLAWMGHTPVALSGTPVEPIFVEHLNKEKVRLMHLKEFSAEALKFAEQWRGAWEGRLILGENISAKKAA